MMKAAVLKSARRLVVEDVPRPQATGGMCVVRPLCCGICGSDVRYYQGENPWAQHTLGRHVDNPPNIILGHELCAVVEEAPQGFAEEMVGKRAAIFSYVTCRKCRLCAQGKFHLCKATVHLGHGAGWGKMDFYPGGMAEYCQVWPQNIYPVPDGVSDEDAALVDVYCVAMHAVNRGGPPVGDSALILGTGPVGLAILQILKARGMKRVVCLDKYRKALEIASVSGADAVIDTPDAKGPDAVADELGEGAALVFDTIGSAFSQRLGVRSLAECGTMVNLVANRVTVEFSMMDFSGERCVKGTSNALPQEFAECIELLVQGRIHPARMVTHRFSLSRVQQAFDVMLDKERRQAMKVIVQCNESPTSK